MVLDVAANPAEAGDLISQTEFCPDRFRVGEIGCCCFPSGCDVGFREFGPAVRAIFVLHMRMYFLV